LGDRKEGGTDGQALWAGGAAAARAAGRKGKLAKGSAPRGLPVSSREQANPPNSISIHGFRQPLAVSRVRYPPFLSLFSHEGFPKLWAANF